MTTLKIESPAVREALMVRCDLSQADSPVEIDYLEGSGWGPTQYQCANTRHTQEGLAELGVELLASAMQADESDLGECTWSAR